MKKILMVILAVAITMTFIPLLPDTAQANAATNIKAPTTFYGGTTAKGNVELSWGKVSGASQYVIYKDGKALKSVKTIKYIDKNIKQGKTYNYKIKTKAGSQQSAFSYTIKIKAAKDSNVSKVTLNIKSKTLIQGKTYKITAKISPSRKVVSKSLIWKTSDSSVATVSADGKVTAKQAGKCKISARAHSGKTAYCTITVDGPAASATTGTYVGQNNNGICEFLGIRYGDMESFKRATDVQTTTADIIPAKEWGKNCLQPYDEVEKASQDPCSQDCLYLNVWTKDVNTKNKPVIVFIHGGGNVAGGTSDPMYDGESFVRNLPQNEDCVFVTINYRLSFMGGIDLSVLPDYTSEYADAINLTKLDQTQALKWVNENIKAWGGNDDNITIAGQSAAGRAVNALMADPKTNKYFQHAIEDSGVLAYRLISTETAKKHAKDALEILDVDSIEELTSLTDAEISDKIEEINNVTNAGTRCADGNIISKTWWDDLRNGAAKDVDLLIGCVNGEQDWGSIDYSTGISEPTTNYTKLYNRLKGGEQSESNLYGALYAFNYPGLVDNYLNIDGENGDKVKLMQDLVNDLTAAYPNELIAEAQSVWNKDTYNYYWEYAPNKNDVLNFSGDSAEVSPWGRALHCMDLCFAFGTLKDGYTELTGDYTKLPQNLVTQMQQVWYNFAKTGNPNNSSISHWDSFNNRTKETMVITNEAKWKCKYNYRKTAMDILSEIRPYGESE